MRTRLLAFTLVALVAAGAYASTAFQAAKGGTRTVSIGVVGDAAAYLSIEAHSTGAHACHVSTDSASKVQISFASNSACASNGGGTGVNEKSRYQFDDLIKLTNKGHRTLQHIWVNTTVTSGSAVHVSVQDGTGKMRPGNYGPTWTNGGTTLAPGGIRYIGVRVDTGTGLAAGQQFSGTISIDART